MKKITTFLLLVCMLVGAFGSFDVYASGTKTLSISFSDSLYSCVEKEYSELNDDCVAIVSIVDEAYYVGIYSLSYFKAGVSFIYYKDDAVYSTGTNSTNSSSETISLTDGSEDSLYILNISKGDPNFKPLVGFSGCVSGSTLEDCYKSIYNYLKTGSDSNFSPLFDEDTATYDKELGYLSNLKMQVLNRTSFDEANSNIIPTTGEGSFKFKWDDTSTTGVSLADSDIYVQLFTSAGAIYSIGTEINKQLITDVNLNYYQQYNASNLNLIIPVETYFQISNADYQEWYSKQSWWDINTRGIVRRDAAYFRLIRKNDDGTWNYGGYLKLTIGREDGDVDQDSLTPDLEIDPDGPSGDVPVSEGSGTDDDSAGDDADEKEDETGTSDASFENIWDIFQAFLNGISSLQNSIGKVPELIGQMFKAFPNQIITAIGAGFVLAIFLRILGR